MPDILTLHRRLRTKIWLVEEKHAQTRSNLLKLAQRLLIWESSRDTSGLLAICCHWFATVWIWFLDT